MKLLCLIIPAVFLIACAHSRQPADASRQPSSTKQCAGIFIDEAAVGKSFDLAARYGYSDLPAYYHDHLSDTVTLFRGVDAELLRANYIGEDSLVFTSEEIEDAVMYAANDANQLRRKMDRVLVIKIEVPRSMVYQKNSWPVLRSQDYPDIRTVITGIGEIPLTRELGAFVDENPGEQELLMGFIRKKWPSFLDQKGTRWFKGKAMGRFFRTGN